MAMRIVTDLIDYGKVKRGFLGVSLDARYTYEKATSLGLDVAYGALVSAITPNSPAAESDLQIGDVILEFDGNRVHNDSAAGDARQSDTNRQISSRENLSTGPTQNDPGQDPESNTIRSSQQALVSDFNSISHSETRLSWLLHR